MLLYLSIVPFMSRIYTAVILGIVFANSPKKVYMTDNIVYLPVQPPYMAAGLQCTVGVIIKFRFHF